MKEEHELKTWPTGFDGVARGVKLYELRKNDRAYQVGDTLCLKEWSPIHEGVCSWFSPFDEQQTDRDDFRCKECGRGKDDPMLGNYTGREIRAVVTYMTKSGVFPGLKEGFVILGIRVLPVPLDKMLIGPLAE